eukprot:132605_1
MSQLQFLYRYNISKSCMYTGTSSIAEFNASYAFFSCANPIIAIHNEYGAQININDMTVDMQITDDDYYESNINNYEYIRYRYANDEMRVGLIVNKGIMTINNMDVKRAISYKFILNENTLTIYNYSTDIDSVSFENYDPNTLHAGTIISQLGTDSSMRIYDSFIYGSVWQVFVTGGNVFIDNSKFEMSMQAIKGIAQSIEISNCIIKNNGVYYGPFPTERFFYYYDSAAISLWWSDYIYLHENIISSFDPKGLIWFVYSNNITFTDNKLIVSTDGLYYDIPNESKVFVMYHPLYGILGFNPLTIRLCTHTTIIGNDFVESDISSSRAWLVYMDDFGTNCLSANNFSNFGIDVRRSNITSCFRRELVEWTQKHVIDHHNYGSMNLQLKDQMGLFYVDEVIESIISAYDSNIALDNINIIISGNNNSATMLGENSNILFVDTQITNDYDILFTLQVGAHDVNPG